MKKQQFIDLANKYAEGKSTEEETLAVERFFDELQKKGEVLPDAILDAKRDIIFNRVDLSIGKSVNNPGNSWKKIYRIAAALIAMLGLAFAFNLITQETPVITYASARGEKKEIMLNDGSIVVLNSNSSVSVPEKFGRKREVTLTGEAYFKVTRNPDQPFIVSTKDVKVRVLGTSFDINAYHEDNTKVSVLTGRVEVSSPNGKKVILTKNDQADYKQDSGFVLTHENSNEGIEWTNNIIVLKNNSLAETANILENWYDIKIDFESKEIEQLKISGKFKEQDPENVLQSIAILKDLEIKYITKNHVLIRRNTH